LLARGREKRKGEGKNFSTRSWKKKKKDVHVHAVGEKEVKPQKRAFSSLSSREEGKRGKSSPTSGSTREKERAHSIKGKKGRKI